MLTVSYGVLQCVFGFKIAMIKTVCTCLEVALKKQCHNGLERQQFGLNEISKLSACI